MARLKILNIVGARPQFVKMAVVSRAIRNHSGLEEVIVHSGQHFDNAMSQVFFDELNIPKPHHNLGIQGTGNADVVGEMRTQFTRLIQQEKPDWVLVYGDTYTTRAAAEAARDTGVRLAHVEAGLRSFNPEMPEEQNRIIADACSDVLFIPTQTAGDQLRSEGGLKPNAEILFTGDVMLDAALHYSPAQIELPQGVEPGNFVLCTLHRSETTDNPDRLAAAVAGINAVAAEIPVVLPLHPRTAMRMKEQNLQFNFPTLPPQGYLAMLGLLKNCAVALTDSGGLQKEAYFFERFCVTMRSETEWTELVEAGYNKLAGTESAQIVEGVKNALHQKRTFTEGFYGNGNASEIIAKYLADSAERIE